MILSYVTVSSLIYVIHCADIDYFQEVVVPEITLFDRNFEAMRTVCANFSFGNVESGDFSTPNYPDLYPANIECVRVVEAPRGHVIHLDFRGSVFEVERSESSDKCRYDYLEIRNGLYGFSPLIGRFCGNKYPPAITADSGYMWLHFKSDRSIQYRGFKAVTYFSPIAEVDKPDPEIICSFSNNPLDDDGAISTDIMQDTLEQIQNSTQLNAECVWKLETSHVDHKIRIYFEHFYLHFPNDCKENFLGIYKDNTADELVFKKFCGKSASTVTTNSSRVYLRFHMSKASLAKTKILASYTVYIPGSGNNCSSAGYFPCGDDVCISNRLVCNGRSNCVTDNDEKKCPTPPLPSFRQVYGPYLVILVVILLAIALIVTCIAVVNIWPRIKKKAAARQASYSSVPQSVNSTSLFSTATPPPPAAPPSGGSPASPPPLVNCDLVYSTVVPGPDCRDRFYELLPKMSSENLHTYLNKQARTRLANGDALPKKISQSERPVSAPTTTSVGSPEECLADKRRRMLVYKGMMMGGGKKPDVVLNGLTTDGVPKRKLYAKKVKFDQDSDSSARGAATVSARSLVDNSTDQSAATASVTSSTDTLDDLSQVEINRTTTDDDSSDEERSSRSSPISALTLASRKYKPTEEFVMSI